MADEQQRFIDAIAQQGILLCGRQWRARHRLRQGVGLEHDVAVGLGVVFPELGAKERTRQAIATGQGEPIGQAHIGAAQQAIECIAGETARYGGGLQEVLVDAAVREGGAQRLDKTVVPARVHHAETPGVDKQRHVVEPAEEVVPVGRVVFELGQGLLDQAGVARVVLTHELLATARRGRRGPAQRIELVVTHDAQRLAGLGHIVDDMQRLTDAWATVDDIAQEHSHA